MHLATRAIRAGQAIDPNTGAVVVPIYPAVTYAFKEVGVPSAFEYSRSANPTRTALETLLASLEEGTHGLAFGSGMAACDAAMAVLKAGDHVVSATQIYGGTFRLFEAIYKPRGIDFTYVDGLDPENFRRALTPKTRMIWIESPTNPMLELVDIAAVAQIAKGAGAVLVVDNTFASPVFQQPLALGADVVVHSVTKYLGGHSDVLGGAVITSDPELYSTFHYYQNAVGAVLGPFDSWLTLRGIKTLAVRMRAHAANAQAVAEHLAAHPKVTRVVFPGLPEHPQHELAKRQMSGFGAIVTFQFEGGREAANRFAKALQVFTFAESLGGVESLAAHPPTMSHAGLTEAERARLGITESTIRLSVGIEDIRDLIADLDQALAAIG